MTIQVGLATMKGSAFSVSGVLMAATMISALPLAIVYLILQRQFTQGVVMTGIKG
jgi:multiple sugar transport system permease protein